MYFASLRSRSADVLNPPFQREFGGMESGGFSYRFEEISIDSETDGNALRAAKREARKRGMILLEVVKIVYRRRKKLPVSLTI